MYKCEIVGLGIDKRTDHPLVLLHTTEAENILPIWIGPTEAQSIAIVLQGEILKRPLAHDVIISSVLRLNGAFDKLEIHTIREGTFYADLIVRGQDGIEIPIDCRPSDGIAIACRLNLPIYISDQVLNNASMPAIVHFEENNLTEDSEILEGQEKEDFVRFLSTVKASDFCLPHEKE